MNDVNVPEGYKSTDVGVIPEDWEVKEVGNISTVVRGGSPRPAGDPKFFGGYYIPWLTVAALTNIPDSYIYVSKVFGYLTEEGVKQSRTLEKGTLIIANSGATLGVSKILSIKCCANDGIAALIDVDKNINTVFLCYFLNTKTKEFREVIATGNGQPNLNTTLISLVKIPLPPLAEQKAIARVLSDVDKLIKECDSLLAKKRDIKQGTMQQLLTGKKRLPGFSGDWEERKLGDIAPLQRGFDLPNSQLKKGIYPVVYSNGILNHHIEYKAKAPGVVTGRSGTIGKVTYIEEDYFPHNTSLWVTDFKRNFPLFIYYLYINIHLERFGSGSGVPTLNRNDVHLFISLIPPTLPEQKAIAQILSDMDAEIEGLEKKRDKYKAIKQGMMQELLTGKTRIYQD